MPQFTALPPVPAKHSDLIHHFHRRQSVSIPELVKPYNEHDAVVRKIFAQEPEHPALSTIISMWYHSMTEELPIFAFEREI